MLQSIENNAGIIGEDLDNAGIIGEDLALLRNYYVMQARFADSAILCSCRTCIFSFRKLIY